MPQTCVVVNCKNRSSKESDKSFYRFPVDPDQRVKWIAAVNRKNWSPTEYSRVCSDHFVTKKPSKDRSHPDYAPSVSLGGLNSNGGDTGCDVLARHARLAKRKSRAKGLDAAEALLSLHKRPRIEGTEGRESNVRKDLMEGDATQATEVLENNESIPEADCDDVNNSDPVCSDQCCSETSEQLKAIEKDKEQLEWKCAALVIENERLSSQCTQLLAANSQAVRRNTELTLENSHLRAQKFGSSLIENDDNKTLFYTGLPTYKLFSTLFDILEPYYNLYCHGTPNIDYFFAVLVYLRLHTPMNDLAYRLQISKSRVSRLFHSWMNTMYSNLQPLVTWPDTATLRENLPAAFKKHFSNVKCIIDCFEIFIQRPVSFHARAATYSNYKKHNTVKVLIGISPSGVITFISQAWTGRVSDKVITKESGFLDNIEYGDVILADRGFNIHDELALIGARLQIPAFTKGKKQLSREEVEISRRLARVRIHVERVIGQLRRKYKILQETLPISLIKKTSDDSIATIDKIIFVTAALTNLSQTVVP